jgi:hypothetical protein
VYALAQLGLGAPDQRIGALLVAEMGLHRGA